MRPCELEWDERLVLEPIDEVSFLADLINQLLSYGHGEKLVQDDPLVVPSTDSTSLFEEPVTASEPGAQVVDDGVMKPEKCQMQLRDDGVHVVPGVGNQRQALRVSRHIPGDSRLIVSEKKSVGIILVE